MAAKALTLAVDIGGTKTAAGVVDRDGKVLVQARRATPASAGGVQVLSDAVELARHVSRDVSSEIGAVGIGAGGQVNSDEGVIVSATALLPGWGGQRVGERFTEEFRVPVFVENDVNALALGEYLFGAARSVRSLAFVALGTGVGGALLLGGQPFHGAHWAGAEFGHIVIDVRTDARLDLGGHQGTLEAYASGHGLVTTWREITGDRGEITGEQIAAYAAEDDGGPAALAVRETGRYLGLGLVSIVSVCDPDMIVIGGGMAALGELLVAPARAALSARALAGPANCPLLTTALSADGPVIGPAAVAMVKMNV